MRWVLALSPPLLRPRSSSPRSSASFVLVPYLLCLMVCVISVFCVCLCSWRSGFGGEVWMNLAPEECFHCVPTKCQPTATFSPSCDNTLSGMSHCGTRRFIWPCPWVRSPWAPACVLGRRAELMVRRKSCSRLAPAVKVRLPRFPALPCTARTCFFPQFYILSPSFASLLLQT